MRYIRAVAPTPAGPAMAGPVLAHRQATPLIARPHLSGVCGCAIMAERQLSDFGPDNSANQPLQFDFPKREFGKTKIVKRAFQAQWFGKWRWLHYDCSRDLAFCHTCVTAFKTSKLKLSSGNVKDSACLFHQPSVSQYLRYVLCSS